MIIIRWGRRGWIRLTSQGKGEGQNWKIRTKDTDTEQNTAQNAQKKSVTEFTTFNWQVFFYMEQTILILGEYDAEKLKTMEC